MSEFESDWRQSLLALLENAAINVRIAGAAIEQWHISAEDWQRFAELAKQQRLRWAAGWAEHLGSDFVVNACFEKQGRYLWLKTTLTADNLELPSQAGLYPAASRSERHSQDMFGVNFAGHPDSRPWTRHKAWNKHQYPLRKDFPLPGEPEKQTPPDIDYNFIKARGSGVYEIPVGPVHAGIIEPGHFRFQAVGETVLHLEERLGYVHKGIEKLAEGRSPEALTKLAGRISGDSTVAHSWAACRAMELAAGLAIPPRAGFIRALLCERERIANHLGDIGAICNDVGFAFAQMQFSRLRELWQRSQAETFGHRLLMDSIVPGGVNTNLSDEHCALMQQEIQALRAELDELLPALDLNSSLEDRLLTTGFLSTQTAELFGCLGYVGRASGQDFDVRRDAPYPPYDHLAFKAAVETQGDVASRLWIRVKEIFAAIKLIEQILQQLPGGDIIAPWRRPPEHSEGLAMIEGWRGEIITYVRFADDNRVSRFYARDPSLLNWPALERIVLNNIVPDFPVCNKSVNGSYSGHDL
ncbi:NADH-quinone oxidoreductase subunit C [Methylomarinum sp. Ch1-1]|uniref:NADH-quinone oxidoreductase subunit C n=1 Tax=Methylomarinum roseum TaxID=3067653 RepID=A0AAU7P0M8_9GAMM|nr:NADH-quinone oxidoreductase subunit C [Methylomarinum sp. Ch1-1]MDP4521531.1 NADH-quinone oxidoreductase subunit C [Methylomarinum sp. Ch1-1]